MADRVRVQVMFKKAIWTCPTCGLEETEDRPMEGGASYEHTCANGHKFNQSGSNMRSYEGCVSYTPAEYETLKAEDLATEKQARCDAWLYSVKNPPAYVEPTAEEVQRMIDEKQAEVTRLTAQKAEIVAKIEVEPIIEDIG